MWITLSIWNGANFYMEYFSRKYESSLKALEQIEVSLGTQNAEAQDSNLKTADINVKKQ